jgi:multidrug resistance efflux pump
VTRANAAAEVELTWRRRELQTEMFDARMKLATLQSDRLNRQVEQIAWREHLTSTPQWTGSAAADPILRPITLSSPVASVDRLQAVLKEDAAALAAESLTAQIELCDRRLTDLATLEQRLEANVWLSAGVEVAERRLAAAEAELAALRNQHEQLTIRSGGHGVVGAIHRQPGDLLSAGDAILDVLDDEQRTVIVRVPTRQLGRIQSGGRVLLQFPDHVRREGIVGPIPPHAVLDRASATDETELQIPILPAGKLWPKIPTGTRVDVALLRR